MDRFTISGVGHLTFFEDPAGNPVGAMQYDPAAEWSGACRSRTEGAKMG